MYYTSEHRTLAESLKKCLCNVDTCVTAVMYEKSLNECARLEINVGCLV